MRLIKRNFFFIAAILGLIIIGNNVFAQNSIATERPTQSIGSLVLPGNSFQFEQGFTYKSDTLELDGFFRLGVSDIGELRLFTYYDSPLVTIGAKVNLLKDKNYRPGIAIRVELTGAKVTDYRLAIMQKLSEQFSATFNIGYTTTTYGILAIGYSFADKFGTFLEGYAEKDYSQINTGLTFVVNSETQLDITTGILNFDAGYVGIGFARRFMFKKDE
jgi:hypothetical protein